MPPVCCSALLRLLAPILLLLISGPGAAAVVENLYEAEVPVGDHSQQALAVASRAALSEVLVKVSGSTGVLDNPAVDAELGRARSHVQQYSYTRDEDAEGDLAARFEFDSSVVSRMITDAGAPLWTANRPEVLVWLTAEGATGRQFINSEVAPDVMKSVRQGFARRGVPVRFPLFDLQDSAMLTIDDAWRLQAMPITSASQRYGVQDILAGRLTSLSTGELVGDWTYLFEGGRVDRSISADSLNDFLAAGAALVAEKMAGRYAVAASRTDPGGIKMSVVGVTSYDDYANIVAWLESLELVTHANIETIKGNEIVLRLDARADAVQLKTIVELNQRLVPAPVPSSVDSLSYQWRN